MGIDRVARLAIRKTAEERAATKRAYMVAHADLYRNANRKHRARMRAEQPEKWASVLAKQNEHRKVWAKTPSGRESVRLFRQAQRASRRAATTGGVSRDEWRSVCARYADEHGETRCAYCFAPCAPTIDHVVPIMLGGKHEPSNVAPACSWCNTSKGARLLSEWLGVSVPSCAG